MWSASPAGRFRELVRVPASEVGSQQKTGTEAAGRKEEAMVKRRVLIVDDNADFRAGIRAVLERAGYAVAEAPDGSEGLAMAERFCPDVILLDVLMPNLDGCEVCQRLKENPPTAHIAVIFVTAMKDDAVHQLALEAGAAAYITKPFRFEDLVAVIEAAFPKPEHQAEPEARHDGRSPGRPC